MGDMTNGLASGFIAEGSVNVYEFAQTFEPLGDLKGQGDDLSNGVSISPDDVHWVHVQGPADLIFASTIDNTNTADEVLEIVEDFNKAKQIAFDLRTVFLFGEHDLHVYELVDTQTAGEYAFFKKYTIKLSDNMKQVFDADFPQDIRISLRCNCFIPKILRFTCFSNTLNCISTTANM